MAKNPHKGNQVKSKHKTYKHPTPAHQQINDRKRIVTKTRVPSKGY